ncbi:nephrocystin-3-like [Dorcoceras hygrometricum]|uniref:Nephrocystin-3-like n=1 Tax=Dorcoceras hygrometricum TaxID=472368 RepID=A0A2Z7CR19_9LAMI|nr:nephrocystin-3-like [Dorcoceras hygrometricum]
MSASGESSTTMHRLLHASGSHPIPPPYDPNSKRMRRHFVVATGSPAASEFGRYYLLLVCRESLRLDDVSGATSFELVATLRFEVATGSGREKRTLFCLATGYPAAGSMRRRLIEEREVATVRVLCRFGRATFRFSLLSVLGFDPMSLRGLVCFFVVLFSGNPGSTGGRGFNPAGGAPGGG